MTQRPKTMVTDNQECTRLRAELEAMYVLKRAWKEAAVECSALIEFEDDDPGDYFEAIRLLKAADALEPKCPQCKGAEGFVVNGGAALCPTCDGNEWGDILREERMAHEKQ